MARIRVNKSGIDYSNVTPAMIMKYESLQEMSREYTALRDIFQKRFKRMEAAGDDVTGNSAVYQYWHNQFHQGIPTLKSLHGDTRQIAYQLSKMKRDMSEVDSTKRGVKRHIKNILTGLHDSGYDFVDEKNLKDFGKFMEMFRARKLDNVIGSPTIAEIYGKVRTYFSKAEILKNWEYFKNNLDVLDDMTPGEIKADINDLALKRKYNHGRKKG